MKLNSMTLKIPTIRGISLKNVDHDAKSEGTEGQQHSAVPTEAERKQSQMSVNSKGSSD